MEVPTGTAEGHGILVTGHSYKALYELLKQIKENCLEGEIKVYTHAEMFPAHVHLELRKCVQQLTKAYKDRIFTVGIAGLEGVPMILCSIAFLCPSEVATLTSFATTPSYFLAISWAIVQAIGQ
ncbi:hypothetical protein PFDSM3638_03440 [Pyrococcus furiosus DSM 3638]|uniref:Uncharacterized protein n=3 Tax=Pyrococcus furiosus TaxID=2261 RepID=A0A5C0XMS1_PYRFU|nr:hypothetical protein PF0689 [Pyrococcus furiosus DSM 3638]AFN03483.1 hypothetical protein PFC_02605 [Pyrococcus furiosus COM1]QEK78386.1 hypothetical protein PFDSM3638_03440 [Pyrococcus furiosus DSM 3638]